MQQGKNRRGVFPAHGGAFVGGDPRASGIVAVGVTVGVAAHGGLHFPVVGHGKAGCFGGSLVRDERGVFRACGQEFRVGAGCRDGSILEEYHAVESGQAAQSVRRHDAGLAPPNAENKIVQQVAFRVMVYRGQRIVQEQDVRRLRAEPGELHPGFLPARKVQSVLAYLGIEPVGKRADVRFERAGGEDGFQGDFFFPKEDVFTQRGVHDERILRCEPD